jgi:hypothetical protein
VTDHLAREPVSGLSKQSTFESVQMDRRSSSGSEKEAEIIGVFLRSNVKAKARETGGYIVNKSDTSRSISRENSNQDSVHSFSLKASTKEGDHGHETLKRKRSESSSSESSRSSTVNSEQTSSRHSDINLVQLLGFTGGQGNSLSVTVDETARTDSKSHDSLHNEFLATALDNSYLHTSPPASSKPTHQNRTGPHIGVGQQDGDFQTLQKHEENNANAFTNIDTYALKGGAFIVNDTISSRQSPHADRQGSPDIYVDGVDRSGHKALSYRTDSARLTQGNASSTSASLFNRSRAQAEPHSVKRDSGSYNDTLGLSYARDNARTRPATLKSPGLDSSPIFPSLLSLGSREVQEQTTRDFNNRHNSEGGHFSPRSYFDLVPRNRTTQVSANSLPIQGNIFTHTGNSSTRRATQSESYAPSFDFTDTFFNNTVFSTSRTTSDQETLGADYHTALGSDYHTALGSDAAYTYAPRDSPLTSPTSDKSDSSNRDQHQRVEAHLHTTPIAITTAAQSVVGNRIGVHIDFSPNGSFHKQDTHDSSSDDKSRIKLFRVRNVSREGSLKNSPHSPFTTEDNVPVHFSFERPISATNTPSSTTVGGEPTYRVTQSPRTYLSGSLSSDASGTSLQHGHISYSRQDTLEKSLSFAADNEGGNVYRVRNLSSSIPDGLNAKESQRRRSHIRSPDHSEQKQLKSVQRRPHSPERFFKNPTLSLQIEDSVTKGYFPDEVDSKEYRTVTKVYINDDQPSSRSQSARTRYGISSLQRQASFEDTRGHSFDDDKAYFRSAKSVDYLPGSSAELSDDSDSGFQGHQQKYRIVETSDSSLDRRLPGEFKHINNRWKRN